MHLTPEAIAATLAAVGRLAPGSELIMEYALPSGLRDARGSVFAEFALPAAAERGEPWPSFFTPDDLSTLLGQHRLEPVEQLRQAAMDFYRSCSDARGLRPDLAVFALHDAIRRARERYRQAPRAWASHVHLGI
ncbi:hypothetical protein [Streptosporangium sp. NPDC049644]|uniref:hypothetical protein n=1 Tax=Streptosporangium sp. NPDC049644 TaxID=3155507 RepID=UPI0034206DDF